MRIGLISCAKQKTAHAAPARELYGPSALFRGALNDLEGRVDEAYVLSAKYGLLSLDEVVEPYDLYSQVLWSLLEGAGATCTSPVAGLTMGGGCTTMWSRR